MLGIVLHARDNYESKNGTILVSEKVSCQIYAKKKNEITIRIGK